MSEMLDPGDGGGGGGGSTISVVDIGLEVSSDSAISTVDVRNGDSYNDYDVTVSFTATSNGADIVSTEQNVRVGPETTRSIEFVIEHSVSGGEDIEACANVVDIEPVSGL